jgi:protein TonB
VKHRLAFDRTHALALVAVLVLHGGLLYALWSVRVPARPDEAKVLFVSLVEPVQAKRTAAPPAAAAPSAPAAGPAAPRPERKAQPAVKPDRAEVMQKPAPMPKSESVPVDAAPAELTVDAPATSPAEATAPPTSPAPTPSAPTGSDENAAGDGLQGARAGAASDGPVSLASELALACSERRAPPYPSVSRRLGEAGRVVLRVELDATGRVVQAQIVDSSGFSRLDAAALAAVRNWRCKPPRRDGQAVGAVALQPFDFTLDGP